MVGLVEAAGDSIEVGGVGGGGGVGVCSGEGNGATIINLSDEPLGEEGIGGSEGGCDKVWESEGYA